MYLDGAYRIDHGQVPDLDFFLPMGPLSVYGYWATQKLFPNAHPLFAAQLSYMFLGLPLLALTLNDIRSRTPAILIAGIYFVLAFFPANFFPRLPIFLNSVVDGYGIYNRQAGLLLYPLIAAIWWCRSTRRFILVATAALTGLLFTKITAFLIAVALVLFAVPYRGNVIRLISLIFAPIALTCVLLEATTGIVSAYAGDIKTMIAANGLRVSDSSLSHLNNEEPAAGIALDPRNSNYGGAVQRIYVLISAQIETLLVFGLLLVAALVRDIRGIATAVGLILQKPIQAIRALTKMPSVSLGVLLVAAVLLESQNGGSQEFAFVLPALVFLMTITIDNRLSTHLMRFVCAALLFFMAIKVIDRSMRISLTAITGQSIQVSTPDRFRVVTKPQVLTDARAWLDTYMSYPKAFEYLLDRGGRTISDTVEAEVVYFLSVGNAVRALQPSPSIENIPFKSIVTLDFVDPFSMLLGLAPVPGQPIVVDPGRTVSPTQISELVARWSASDAILVPLCPQTLFRSAIFAFGRPALVDRQRLSIDPCWDLYVRRRAS